MERIIPNVLVIMSRGRSLCHISFSLLTEATASASEYEFPSELILREAYEPCGEATSGTCPSRHFVRSPAMSDYLP